MSNTVAHIVTRSPSPLDESPVKYLNRNTGKWAFGWRVDSLFGFTLVWTPNEALALTDDGALGRQLGLGTGGGASDSHRSSSGASSSGWTNWDSILESVASSAPVISGSAVKLHSRIGGVVDAVRVGDGATAEDIHAHS